VVYNPENYPRSPTESKAEWVPEPTKTINILYICRNRTQVPSQSLVTRLHRTGGNEVPLHHPPMKTNIKHKEFHLLGYNMMQSVESQQKIRRNISPPSSGSKNKPSKKPA
jgi:hypothetical protein